MTDDNYSLYVLLTSSTDDVYHEIRSPGCFGGVNKLRRYAGKRRKDVVDYLKRQDAYTLHKPIRR